MSEPAWEDLKQRIVACRACPRLTSYRERIAQERKKAYRDRLRQASPGLCFAFLQISPADAQARVGARGEAHFFSTQLVDSQFATLQVPTGEPGVLTLDATAPLPQLQAEVAAWLTMRALA